VEGFHRGDWHRLQIGAYRVLYAVEGDLVTVVRVDRASGS
jgi:mRNA-degrading endonuclease RelE of RelBE toxin-antitoxin system